MTKEFLPFHVPDLGKEELQAAGRALSSCWITTGPKTQEFEIAFARYVSAEHAVGVNSGTAALHLALEAVNVREGDEVIIPTMTFAATAEFVHYLKARPVLVDCQPETLNMGPNAVEEAITPKTKAIIPVHFGGQPCDMFPILELAKNHGLRIVEDAAHALPALYKSGMIGTIGDITCFSFYATKTITTGEGGMATTENPEWADRMRRMSLHGISKDAWNRYSEEGSWYYEILEPGYKYNMTDIAAAIGIEQLKKCDRFWQARASIARRYTEGFADLPEVVTPVCQPHVQHAWHLYVIKLQLERLRIDRAQFIEMMKKEGIGTSVHFIPLHLHPYYRKTFGYRPEDFPVATDAYHRIVSLPIYPRMSDSDVERVIGAVHKIIAQYRR